MKIDLGRGCVLRDYSSDFAFGLERYDPKLSTLRVQGEPHNLGFLYSSVAYLLRVKKPHAQALADWDTERHCWCDE